MKHKVRSASYFEFACPHLSDHRTQEAKPKSKNNHGRSVPLSVYPVHPLWRAFPVSVYFLYSVVNLSLSPSLASVRNPNSSARSASPRDIDLLLRDSHETLDYRRLLRFFG